LSTLRVIFGQPFTLAYAISGICRLCRLALHFNLLHVPLSEWLIYTALVLTLTATDAVTGQQGVLTHTSFPGSTPTSARPRRDSCPACTF